MEEFMQNYSWDGIWNFLWTCLCRAVSAFVTILLIIVFGVIGVFVFINFSEFLLREDFLSLLTGARGYLTVYPEGRTLSDDETQALELLIKSGDVLTQDQLLGVITEFYNNIINELIVVISLLGIIAYFSIKSLSRSHAEDIAEKMVSKELMLYLSNDDNVNRLLNRSTLIQSIGYGEQERQSLLTQVRQLEARLSGIEYELMNLNGVAGGEGSEVKDGD